MTARILTFVESLEGGGVERVALRLAGLWAAAGRQVTIVAGSLRGPLLTELPSGVEIIEIGTKYYGPLGLGVAQAVRRLRPDILFCPGNYYSAIAVGARLLLGVDCPPILCKISNALQRPDFNLLQQGGYTAWLRFHARWIDHFVAMSDGMSREAISVAHIRPAKISVIANPASRAPASLPPRNTDSDEPPLVLGVGRLSSQKRFHKLVEAFALAGRSDARLVILGEGEERGRIEGAARRLGISQSVTLPGHVSDPLQWMARAHVTALSSAYEGMPNILRESLSVGTPVVTTACSGAIAEVIDRPILGSIVPINDTRALASAIRARLAKSPDRKAIAASANREDAAQSACAYLDLMDRIEPARCP